MITTFKHSCRVYARSENSRSALCAQLKLACQIIPESQRNSSSTHEGNYSSGLKGKKINSGYNYGLPGLGKTKSRVQEKPEAVGEILFGIHPVILAFAAQRRLIHRLYMRDTMATSTQPFVKQLLKDAQNRNIPVNFCNKTLLDVLSQSRPHQGLCADVDRLEYDSLVSISTDDSKPSGIKEVWLILDSIQDPMNFGAILRSSYFLGVDRILVVRDNSCSLTPVVSKASAGAMEITSLYSIPDLAVFLKEYINKGWTVLGTASANVENKSKLVSFQTVTLDNNTIVILGNEGRGMTQAIQKLCHGLLTILPGRCVHPLVDCLNVSVACGIILHKLCETKIRSRFA